MTTHDLTTPALLLEQSTLRHDLETTATALPEARLRPHVREPRAHEVA